MYNRNPLLLLSLCLAFMFAQHSVDAQVGNTKSISSAAKQSISDSEKSRILPQNRADRQSIIELALIGRINLNPSVSRRLKKLDKQALSDASVISKDSSGQAKQKSLEEIEDRLLQRVSRNQLIEATEGLKLIRRAEANVRLKRYGKALEVYDLILKAYPAETSSLLGRAECFYQRKKYKDTVGIYKETKKILGKEENSMRYRPLIMKNVADACYREKNFFESANIYNLICNGGSSRLIKIDFTGQASRGKSLFTVGDYKKSAKSFRKALKYTEKLHGKPFTGTTGNDDLERRVEKLEDRIYSD